MQNSVCAYIEQLTHGTKQRPNRAPNLHEHNAITYQTVRSVGYRQASSSKVTRSVLGPAPF